MTRDEYVRPEPIKLPSGRSISGEGAIGIDERGRAYEGHDNELHDHSNEQDQEHGNDDFWPAEDRKALAEIMIKRWQTYADAAAPVFEQIRP